MADIFAVVADATRRDVLRILLRRGAPQGHSSAELSVSELVAELGLSQPTVSKHLRVLREAGLVSVREQGQHRYYRLEVGPLDVVRDWVAPYVSAVSEPGGDGTVVAPAGAAPAPPAIGAGASAFAGSLGRLAADIRHRVNTTARRPGGARR